MKSRFIAVEGTIGVGKTSLAQLISKEFNYSLLEEIVEENPFLGKFYENISEWSFQTEMFFLCNRYKQLQDSQLKLKTSSIVSDYHILKNMIFAKRTLHGRELKLYEEIYTLITNELPTPDGLIYIRASLETILHRIDIRGREIEKQIQASYLDQLNFDYNQAISEIERKSKIPLLIIDGDKFDFMQNLSDRQIVLQQIKSFLQ